MKKMLIVFMLIAVACLVAVPGEAQQSGVGNAGAWYNPATLYDGAFNSEMLFFKNHPEDTTWRRISYFGQLYKVTCREALDSLKRTGTWQGHLNLKNGSCAGVEEPAAWATGNWRNYDRLRNGK
jgi:hypothetical protein